MTRTKTHDGAAVKARNQGNRTRTGPSCNLSDWPIQHNRSGRDWADLYQGGSTRKPAWFACGLTARCLASRRSLS